MKCPICGSEEILYDRNLPFDVYGDARLNSIASVHICANCGYVMMFNKHLLDEIKQKKDEISKLKEEAKPYKDELKKLLEKPFDKSRYENDIAKWKNEIKILKEMGEEGKSVRSRLELINEAEEIIKNGKDPNIKRNIDSLEIKIRNIENKISDLEKTIK